MNNLPRQTLQQIVAKHGPEICRDARHCENLLNDLCGSHRREINVLVNAIQERVPLDLMAADRSMPLELLLSKLEKRLEEETALTAKAARWAVESWAIALKVATESEILARQERIETVTPPISKTIQPDDSNGSVVSNDNRHPDQQPRMSPTIPPPRAVPPVMRQPSSPPVIFSTNNQPINLPVPQSPPIQPAARKSFGLFRGCLVVAFLLAVASVILFFGVPFAIEKMRETQRERNNEPPRFPIR